jgi:hypothetical protein
MGNLGKTPRCLLKKLRQLKEKSQDDYEKAWTTNVPKNPCNL